MKVWGLFKGQVEDPTDGHLISKPINSTRWVSITHDHLRPVTVCCRGSTMKCHVEPGIEPGTSESPVCPSTNSDRGLVRVRIFSQNHRYKILSILYPKVCECFYNRKGLFNICQVCRDRSLLLSVEYNTEPLYISHLSPHVSKPCSPQYSGAAMHARTNCREWIAPVLPAGYYTRTVSLSYCKIWTILDVQRAGYCTFSVSVVL